MEVRRDEAGAFPPDELALCALTASVAAGAMVRAEVLEKLIFVDRLTSLWNRAYFDVQIEREIERANRMGTSVALLMVDVDHFKRINDRFGHQAGDQALAHVAAIIRSNIRQIDLAARYGGEEFAVLLPSVTRARAARTAERLRRVVADARFGDIVPALGDSRVSISLGFALYPDDAATAKQLIDRADRVALYAAKSRGRNRVVPWSASPDTPPIESAPSA
jgi:diguanylate cyclase (GGDEF)-like protein